MTTLLAWQDRLTEPEVEERPVRRQALSLYLEPSRGQAWPEVVSDCSQAREVRDLTSLHPPLTPGIFQARSWKSIPRTPALTDRRRLRDIPRIFIFHGSTLKTYFKEWNR